MTRDRRVGGWAGRLAGSPTLRPLAEAHALSAAADACVAVSLAGSLFFSVSVDAARPRIVFYLVLTMAPFAVVAPLVAPFVDRVRGGHRLVVLATCLARAGVVLALAGNLRTIAFYPLAFTVLVLGKTYSVAKNALVPHLVGRSDDLVGANAGLARVATVGGATGAAVAGGVLQLLGAPWVLVAAALGYVGGGAAALAVPPPAPTAGPAPAAPADRSSGEGPDGPVEPGDVAGLEVDDDATPTTPPGVGLAATATSVLRGAVGFLFFLLAFSLRQAGAPAWFFAVVAGASGVGAFAGTFLAPRLRKVVPEEALLLGALAAPAVVALLAASAFGPPVTVLLALVIGLAAGVGRHAFDSQVQRDVPAEVRGRAFARFETRFQLAWVAGGLVPVALRPPPWLALLLLGAALAYAALAYLAGLRRLPPEEVPAWRAPLPGPERLAADLLRTASRLLAAGAHREAVVVAAAAVQVADEQRDGAAPAPGRGGAAGRDELERLHGAAVAGPAPPSAAEAARAVALARLAVSPPRPAARSTSAAPRRRSSRRRRGAAS